MLTTLIVVVFVIPYLINHVFDAGDFLITHFLARHQSGSQHAKKTLVFKIWQRTVLLLWITLTGFFVYLAPFNGAESSVFWRNVMGYQATVVELELKETIPQQQQQLVDELTPFMQQGAVKFKSKAYYRGGMVRRSVNVTAYLESRYRFKDDTLSIVLGRKIPDKTIRAEISSLRKKYSISKVINKIDFHHTRFVPWLSGYSYTKVEN